MTTPPQTIWIIRHGEKPEGSIDGIDSAGRVNKHSLTTRGWQRAGALGMVFTRPPKPGTPPLSEPDSLLCPTYGSATDTQIHRPFQTLTGLAGTMNQKIKTPFSTGQEKQLGDAVVSDYSGTVLICWEHDHIPAIAQALPTTPGTVLPDAWPSDRYDLIWQFSLDGQRYSFDILPQHALGGDGPAPALHTSDQ